MPTVSSLVVQRRLATLRQVEEALARQAIYGGDVVTNLLEVAPPPATSETELTRALADALGVEPASRAAMEAPDAQAIAKVPRAVAEEHAFVPVAFSNEALVVALAEPLSESGVDALREKVGAPVVQVAAPLFRLRQALELAYGLPMDRRTRRLIAKLEGRESMTPPPSTSELGQAFARRDLEADPLRKEMEATSATRPSELHSTTPSASPAGEPAHTPTGKSNRPAPATTIRTSNPGPQALQWFLRSARDARRPSDRAGPPTPDAAPREVKSAEPVGLVRPPNPVVAPAPETQRASPRSVAPKLAAKKRRGPFTRAEAEEALTVATHADEAFAALFEFAQQYMTYAALFLVKEDLAEGFDAHGPGASAERVRKMGVPLDLPSAFAAARDERVPVFRRGEREGLDAVIASDLDRALRGDLAVIPIIVGKRPVALLYCDDARERLALDELAEVLAVASITGAALTRIIVRRKQKSLPAVRTSDRPPMRSDRPPMRAERPSMPGVAERARALAGALGGKRAGTTARPPPSSVVPPPPSSVVPVSRPIPSIAQPTIPATPASLIGLMRRSTTPPPSSPRPYTSTSDPPAAGPMSMRDPVPAASTRITQRMPTAPKAPTPPPPSAQPPTPAPLDDVPRPSTGRSTDPYGGLHGAEPLAPIARIDLIAVPTAEPAAARVHPETALPVLPAPSEPPPPHEEHEPMPLMSAMPMAPPPAFATKRALPPLIPREDPLHETKTPAPKEETPTIEPINLESPRAASSEPDLLEAAEVSDDELEELLELAQPPMREGERLEAYPPRSPPRPMPPERVSGSLPKVIVAIDPESLSLVERLLRGGEAGEKAAAALRSAGLAALPALMERFPGPTRVDRVTPVGQLPRPQDAGPVLGMLTQLGRLALLDLVARTGDPTPDARFWATYLLTEIVDPASADALVPRLVDDDLAVRRVAGLAARVLLERVPSEAASIVDPLVGVLLDPGAPAPLRARSAHALADVREARAVDGLILGLESYDEELGRACHDALVAVTRHDPTASNQTWPSWYSKHKGQHRVEWLIEALLDEPEPIRDAAGGELKTMTKQYFGYYANLPRLERQAAQQRYKSWWETEGKKKFTPPAAS